MRINPHHKGELSHREKLRVKAILARVVIRWETLPLTVVFRPQPQGLLFTLFPVTYLWFWRSNPGPNS